MPSPWADHRMAVDSGAPHLPRSFQKQQEKSVEASLNPSLVVRHLA